VFVVRKREDEEIALEVSFLVVEKEVWSLHCRRPATLDMRETEAKRADMKNTQGGYLQARYPLGLGLKRIRPRRQRSLEGQTLHQN
jgi:hypothetical protein